MIGNAVRIRANFGTALLAPEDCRQNCETAADPASCYDKCMDPGHQREIVVPPGTNTPPAGKKPEAAGGVSTGVLVGAVAATAVVVALLAAMRR